MKIAFIVPALRRLGPVLMIKNLTDHFCGINDLDIKILYIDKNKDTDLKFNVTVNHLNIFRFKYEDYDIIHTNGIRPDLLAFFFRRRIKYHISTIHCLIFDDLEFRYNKLISVIFGRLWLFAWKNSDKLVCLSHSMYEYYHKWFDDTQLTIIYNGTKNLFFEDVDNDIKEVIQKFHLQGKIVLGTAGILTKVKGIDVLLNHVAGIKEIAVIIIGDGEENDRLNTMTRRLGIVDRTYFAGYRIEANQYFQYFDFFVMASRSEGFCMALMEAVQQRIPVIIPNLNVFTELFNGNEVSFYSLESDGSFAKAVKYAMENKKLISDSAYIKYENNFTDKHMNFRYLNLYKSSVGDRSCNNNVHLS